MRPLEFIRVAIVMVIVTAVMQPAIAEFEWTRTNVAGTRISISLPVALSKPQVETFSNPNDWVRRMSHFEASGPDLFVQVTVFEGAPDLETNGDFLRVVLRDLRTGYAQSLPEVKSLSATSTRIDGLEALQAEDAAMFPEGQSLILTTLIADGSRVYSVFALTSGQDEASVTQVRKVIESIRADRKRTLDAIVMLTH